MSGCFPTESGPNGAYAPSSFSASAGREPCSRIVRINTRSLALGLAANRILFGAGFMLSPEKTAKSWVGPVAASAGAGVMIRTAGARDVALGAGTLTALHGYADPRPWFAAHLVSDATDVVATWTARRELGPARSLYAIAVGSASTAVATAYLIGQAKAPSRADGAESS
jgi:hypothetical protein